MPAPYHSFKIRGPKEVACWQQCHTMSISPQAETLNLTSPTWQGSWTRQQGFPVLIVNHSVEQGGKAGHGFKCAARGFSLQGEPIFLKSKLRYVEV